MHLLYFTKNFETLKKLTNTWVQTMAIDAMAIDQAQKQDRDLFVDFTL